MNTSHVVPFIFSLVWSDLVEGVNSIDILAACPGEGEYYFVSQDDDTFWAGLILSGRAFSKEVGSEEEGRALCQEDFEYRLKLSYKNSEFNQKVK